MSSLKMGHLEMALGVVSRLAGEKIKNHKVLMDLKRTKKSVAGATEEFLEAKNDLIMEYGQEADGGGFTIDPKAPYFDEFQLKYDELVNSEATGVSLIPLPEDHLGIFEVSVDDIEILEFVGLIKFRDEEPAPLAAVN